MHPLPKSRKSNQKRELQQRCRDNHCRTGVLELKLGLTDKLKHVLLVHMPLQLLYVNVQNKLFLEACVMPLKLYKYKLSYDLEKGFVDWVIFNQCCCVFPSQCLVFCGQMIKPFLLLPLHHWNYVAVCSTQSFLFFFGLLLALNTI